MRRPRRQWLAGRNLQLRWLNGISGRTRTVARGDLHGANEDGDAYRNGYGHADHNNDCYRHDYGDGNRNSDRNIHRANDDPQLRLQPPHPHQRKRLRLRPRHPLRRQPESQLPRQTYAPIQIRTRPQLSGVVRAITRSWLVLRSLVTILMGTASLLEILVCFRVRQ